MRHDYLRSIAVVCAAMFVTPAALAQACSLPGSDAGAEVRMTVGATYSFEYDGTVYERQADILAPGSAWQTAACPIVIMLPASCNQRSSIDWAPPILASKGYIVMSLDVGATLISSRVSPEENAAICSAAGSSAIDYMLSASNPYLSDTNTDRVGAVGFSRGASALTLFQEAEPRVDAIVAWDTLSISEVGDAGSPSCNREPAIVRIPRAPALGLASETCDPAVQAGGRNAKTTGMRHWRSYGVPSMQLVMARYSHGSFSSAEQKNPEINPVIAYYTVNWLDRFLKDDLTATERLLRRNISPGSGIAPIPVTEIFSRTWLSAAYLDGVVCNNIFRGCGQ